MSDQGQEAHVIFIISLYRASICCKGLAWKAVINVVISTINYMY